MTSKESAAPLHEGDWSELEGLARAALAGGLSSGEWTVDPSTLWVVSTADNGYRVHVADVRGWGYLTGRGDVCLKLDSEPAYEIQKAWGAHIAAANPATILKLIASARSAPPPSVEVFGSSAEGADTHRVAETAVLVPRDQLETLRTSLQLGNLLPGEGESLISLWLMIADAEARK